MININPEKIITGLLWIAGLAIIGLWTGYVFNSWRFRDLQEKIKLAELSQSREAKKEDPKKHICEWKYLPALGYFWLSCGHVFKYELQDGEEIRSTLKKVTDYCHLCGCRINLI